MKIYTVYQKYVRLRKFVGANHKNKHDKPINYNTHILSHQFQINNNTTFSFCFSKKKYEKIKIYLSLFFLLFLEKSKQKSVAA